MKIKKSVLAIFLAGFIAGAAFMYWFLTDIWPNRHQVYTWTYALRDYREFGEPCETDLVFDRRGYSLGYSYKYKAALWVSYILSADSVGVDVGRSGSFYADPDIPEKYRAKPEDFTNTGYDKGHLAPSATIDFSKAANRETFTLSNVVLQDPRLNRQAWSRLESLERNWTKTKGKLYVVTGPIFTKRPKKINDLALPARFYKVIYGYDANKAIGFILPNKAVPNDEVWKYALAVREVEKETGLNFFSKLDDNSQDQIEKEVESAWWKKD